LIDGSLPEPRRWLFIFVCVVLDEGGLGDAEIAGFIEEGGEFGFGVVVGAEDKFAEEGGDGEGLECGGVEGGVFKDIVEVLGEGAVAGEVGLEDGAGGVGVLEEGVGGLSEGDGADEAVEEGAVAADDINFGLSEGVGEDFGLCAGDFGANADLFEFDGFFLYRGGGGILRGRG
jgi:hypothetical protein